MLTDREIVVKCIAVGGDPALPKAGQFGQGKPVTIGADDSAEDGDEDDERASGTAAAGDGCHDLVGMLALADVARSLGKSDTGDVVQQVSRP